MNESPEPSTEPGQLQCAIKAQLSTDETDALTSAIAGTSDEESAKVLAHVKALPLDGAVEFCRELVKTIREHAEIAEPK